MPLGVKCFLRDARRFYSLLFPKAAPSQIVVEVQQGDIENGIPRSSRYCPISTALIRQGLGRYPTPSTGEKEVLIIHDGWIEGRAEYLLPPTAIEFVKSFDDGEQVQPITFTMRRIRD